MVFPQLSSALLQSLALLHTKTLLACEVLRPRLLWLTAPHPPRRRVPGGAHREVRQHREGSVGSREGCASSSGRRTQAAGSAGVLDRR